MERKFATVLFVDLVGSTSLLTRTDPEVFRRRIRSFLDEVRACVELHGGMLEERAGDAALAAFGLPQAHEDDAERAVRAAFGIHEKVRELGLEVRSGIASGEVLFDEVATGFATGEAVNTAARLQQHAAPGEILLGPGAYRLTAARVEAEDAGLLELKGLDGPLRAWRALRVLDRPVQPQLARAPLVGRRAELDLLELTYERAVQNGRAHLVTIFGEPGVGKSRLVREFVDALEGAVVLSGRCLPYGEGITYWPLAEMIKTAAGISDDDPLDEAFEKLRDCCEDEAVADLLGLASGVLQALRGERGQQEISWAARELMEQLAAAQPLVLVFEDIHWAEEPLLDLVEHLAAWVRAPLLMICLARPELLDIKPAWGGGRLRATAIELEPLSPEESDELAAALFADGALSPEVCRKLLEKTEGNPLFVEETVRMIAESEDGRLPERIPDTLQSLIAARIDRLPAETKTLLLRASVIGRTFWDGAIRHLAPDLEGIDRLLEDLLQRDFVLSEPRSTITGERAFRFKHVMIREVAYAAVTKVARAQYHARFAEWLHERTGDELLEIRAYHLDHAADLLEELDGAPPKELAAEAAAALEVAGKRAFAREVFRSARKLLARAVELEPTLERRFLAARAAWRTGDFVVVTAEMERVRDEAEGAGDTLLEARALTALADAHLRQSRMEGGTECIERALALLADETDSEAHFEALLVRAAFASAVLDLPEVVRYYEEAFSVGLAAGRKDMQTIAAQALAQAHIARLELDRAEPLLTKAHALAEESGSVRAKTNTMMALGMLHQVRGELDGAAKLYEQVRVAAAEMGAATWLGHAQSRLGFVALEQGEPKRAEKLFREAIRTLGGLGEKQLSEEYALLAIALAEQGRAEEAEQYAMKLDELVEVDPLKTLVAQRTALSAVRALQKRDDEAEELLNEAVAAARERDVALFEREPLRRLAQFLRARGRDEEAVAVDERLVELETIASRIA